MRSEPPPDVFKCDWCASEQGDREPVRSRGNWWWLCEVCREDEVLSA